VRKSKRIDKKEDKVAGKNSKKKRGRALLLVSRQTMNFHAFLDRNSGTKRVEILSSDFDPQTVMTTWQ